MIIDTQKIDQVSKDCFEGMIKNDENAFKAFDVKDRQKALIVYNDTTYAFELRPKLLIGRYPKGLWEEYSYELIGKLPEERIDIICDGDIDEDRLYSIQQLWHNFNPNTITDDWYSRMVSDIELCPVYTQDMELLPIAAIQERTLRYDAEQYAAWRRSPEYAKLAEKYDHKNDGKKYYAKVWGEIEEREPYDYETYPSRFMLPTGVEELTHEQIRRRILNFVAMMKDCMTPSVMQHILDALPRTKDGAIVQNMMLCIASLPIWKFGQGDDSTLWIGAYMEDRNKIVVCLKYCNIQGRGIAIDKGWFECTDQPIAPQNAAARKNEKRKMIEAQAKWVEEQEKRIEEAKMQRGPFAANVWARCVEDIDRMDPDLLTDVFITKPDGTKDLITLKRQKQTFTIDKKEITISYDVGKAMKALSGDLLILQRNDLDDDALNSDAYDLDSVLALTGDEEVFTNIKSGEILFTLEENFPEDAKQLTNRQVRNRLMWFIKICMMCAEESVLREIAEHAPKKKNKTLYKKRLLHIASSFVGSDSLVELVLVNTSDMEAKLELRNVRLWHDTLADAKECLAFTSDAFTMRPLEVPQSMRSKK